MQCNVCVDGTVQMRPVSQHSSNVTAGNVSRRHWGAMVTTTVPTPPTNSTAVIASASTRFWHRGSTTDLYEVPDAVPPIHAVGLSSHVATDKDPSKFRSIFSDNLQPIATRGKKARGTLLVDIGCSSKRAPLSVSYYNEISSGHIGSCCC